MKGGSSRSSPTYFRSRAHAKPSSTVLVRTRLAKSYSRLQPAEVAYSAQSDARLRDRPLQIQCFRREMPARAFSTIAVSSPTNIPKARAELWRPATSGRYGSWRYTELRVGVVKAASVNAPKAAVK